MFMQEVYKTYLRFGCDFGLNVNVCFHKTHLYTLEQYLMSFCLSGCVYLSISCSFSAALWLLKRRTKSALCVASAAMRQNVAGLSPHAPHPPTLTPISPATRTLHRQRGRCHGSRAAAATGAAPPSSSPGTGGDWCGICWSSESMAGWQHGSSWSNEAWRMQQF